MAAGGGAKKRYKSGIIVYLRALQGHSGRNVIDPSLQDNVVVQGDFFHYINHIGCAFNLHSIINNGSIPGGQNSSKRQTVFFLPIDPRDKEHKDPEKIDLNVPRRAQYHAGQNAYLPVFCFEGLISEFPKFTYRIPSLRASFSSQVKKNRKPD